MLQRALTVDRTHASTRTNSRPQKCKSSHAHRPMRLRANTDDAPTYTTHSFTARASTATAAMATASTATATIASSATTRSFVAAGHGRREGCRRQERQVLLGQRAAARWHQRRELLAHLRASHAKGARFHHPGGAKAACFHHPGGAEAACFHHSDGAKAACFHHPGGAKAA
eukprot:1184781-Pleurochrysis_carterae.AAC.1